LNVKAALKFAPLCVLYRFPGCYIEVHCFRGMYCLHLQADIILLWSTGI